MYALMEEFAIFVYKHCWLVFLNDLVYIPWTGILHFGSFSRFEKSLNDKLISREAFKEMRMRKSSQSPSAVRTKDSSREERDSSVSLM